MSRNEPQSSCPVICWILSGLTGLGLALSVGPGSGAIVGVGIGLAAFAAMGVFLQRNVCGVALDTWGPFEGLKGVPGWDADQPHDEPKAPPAPAQTHPGKLAPSAQTEDQDTAEADGPKRQQA